jgi:hypothetical protein
MWIARRAHLRHLLEGASGIVADDEWQRDRGANGHDPLLPDIPELRGSLRTPLRRPPLQKAALLAACWLPLSDHVR